MDQLAVQPKIHRDIILGVGVYLALGLTGVNIVSALGTSGPLVLLMIIQLIHACVIYIFFNKYPFPFLSNLNYRKIIAYGLLGAVIAAIVSFPYAVWFGHVESAPPPFSHFLTLAPNQALLYLILYCLLGPLLEEFVFRGLIFRIISIKYGSWFAAVAASLVFAFFHSGNYLTLFIASIIYTVIFIESGSIWSACLAHSLTNVSWFISTSLGLS